MPARRTARTSPARRRKTAKKSPRRRTPRKQLVAAEDLLGFKFVQDGALAPDGSTFVFAVRSARADRKGYDSHLHAVDTETGETRQLTFGQKTDGAPVFSPDGHTLAFVSKRSDHPGIHLLSLRGGEARPLVEKDGAFGDLSFSPDGTRILCTFRPNDPPPGQDESEGKKGQAQERKEAGAAARKGAREEPVYRHIDRLFYRLDGAGFLPREEPQIWTFDVATGAGIQITEGKRGAESPAFSPDGRWIAFVRNMRPDPDLEREWNELFVVSARGGKPRRIATPPGPVSHPSFSPDGKRIAYIGHDDMEASWYEQMRIWVVPVRGAGEARCLTRGFDQPAYDATISDMGLPGGVLRPHWNRRGGRIRFLSCASGASGLYEVGGRGGDPELLTPERIHLAAVHIARDDDALAVGIASTPTQPGEVFRFDLDAGEWMQLTELNTEYVKARDIQRPKRIRFRSTEHTWVEGWILTPPNFRRRRKYPAIVQVHGGPQTQYGYSFFHEMQLMAARGYVVLYTNPRGSQGYGRAFCEAIRGDWGNRDFADVMAGTDYLEALPYVDPKRIGITGGSYGGYMTNWAVGHTRRYKAAVTQRSVVNFEPFFGSSDVGFAFKEVLGGYPWEMLERYRAQSPLTYARKIRTPLLIIHSERDLRCHIEQAESLFATLKILGRRVEFIRFPSEPHGLSRGGRPDRRMARLEKMLEWFERYL